MEASGTVAKAQEIEFNALSGSLSMMSKGQYLHTLIFSFTHLPLVLNDVLDL
jgi:hypothetical protein